MQLKNSWMNYLNAFIQLAYYSTAHNKYPVIRWMMIVITIYLLWTECYVEESVLSALYRISFNSPNSSIMGCCYSDTANEEPEAKQDFYGSSK